METMKKLKELFNIKDKKNKNYIEISDQLNEIYNIKKLNLKDKYEIENRIRFFVENIKDLKNLRDLITENEKLIKERKEEIKNLEHKKENIEDKAEEKKDEKEEKEEKKEKEEKGDIIILNIEEIAYIKNSFNNINKFTNELIKIKNIPFLAFKQLMDGFINPNKFKENKFDPSKKKESIDDKQKTQIHYNKICELYKIYTLRINQIFAKLSNINFEFLEEEQKNKLIEISTNIYIYLTQNQKKRIKEKFICLNFFFQVFSYFNKK